MKALGQWFVRPEFNPLEAGAMIAYASLAHMDEARLWGIVPMVAAFIFSSYLRNKA